jgi:serine/threonine protein kinase
MPLTKIRRIGSSKGSTVSECQDELGHAVAQKKIDRRSISSFALERVFSSASIWKTIRNPGLVTYREVDPEDCQIVMDLMEQSVETRILEGYGDAKTVLVVLRGILQSLAFLHQRGYAHANLKPSNVFFDGEGYIRISDGYLYNISSPGTLPKPMNQKYLTPEHTSDSFGGIGPKTDLYCAGFIALEMFAGDRFGRGFQGIGDNASDSDHAWFQWHGSSLAAPDATLFYKPCPPELAAMIAKLVAKNPDDRFDSAQEALDHLPQSIPSVAKTTTAPHAEQSLPKAAPSASDILDRPSHGIVLAIASGPRAGEMIGTEDFDFAIGFDSDCLLQFAEEDYPSVHAKVTCQRSDQGWRLTRLRGSGVFLNQMPVDERASLRSGDIIRLSWRGPDIQFNLQNPAFSLKSVVRRCFPDRSGPGNPRSAAPLPPNASAAAPQRPTPMGSSEAGRSVPPSPALRNPERPIPLPGSMVAAAPKPPAPPAPASAPPTRASSDSLSSSRNAKASLVTPPSAAAPKLKSIASNASSSATGKFKLSKNQLNLVIAAVGCVVILIALVLVPVSEPSKEKSDSVPRATEPDTVPETDDKVIPRESSSSSDPANSANETKQENL